MDGGMDEKNRKEGRKVSGRGKSWLDGWWLMKSWLGWGRGRGGDDTNSTHGDCGEIGKW